MTIFGVSGRCDNLFGRRGEILRSTTWMLLCIISLILIIIVIKCHLSAAHIRATVRVLLMVRARIVPAQKSNVFVFFRKMWFYLKLMCLWWWKKQWRWKATTEIVGLNKQAAVTKKIRRKFAIESKQRAKITQYTTFSTTKIKKQNKLLKIFVFSFVHYTLQKKKKWPLFGSFMRRLPKIARQRKKWDYKGIGVNNIESEYMWTYGLRSLKIHSKKNSHWKRRTNKNKPLILQLIYVDRFQPFYALALRWTFYSSTFLAR